MARSHTSILTKLVVLIFGYAVVWVVPVNAQIPSAVGNIPTCLPNASFAWSYNSLNQSACQVAYNLGNVCAPGRFGIQSMVPNAGNFYSGPSPSTASPCVCSSVYYSALSVCAICQEGLELRWSEYTLNCTNENVHLTVFPEAVPPGTNVPHWAYQNVTLDDVLNVTLAQMSGDSPESTGLPSTPTTAVQPSNSATNASTTKTRTNSGAIAGGVVGGVAFVAVLAALILFLRRRRRKTSNSWTEKRAPIDPTGVGPSSDAVHPGYTKSPPPKLYNPADPSTFPDANYSIVSRPQRTDFSPANTSESHTMIGHKHMASESSGGYSGVPEI